MSTHTENNPTPHRVVRSYVLRQGRATFGQKKAIDTLWADYVVDLETQAKIKGETLFGRQAPLILEIGFGMGESTFQMAKASPETDTLAVEVHLPGVGSLLQKLGVGGLQNVRIFRADANHVIERLEDASLDQVRIFFPDPWPKRRHEKRRIVQPEFLQRIYPKLKGGGYVHLATDWAPYADYMIKAFSQVEGFSNMAKDGHYIKRPDFRPLTKFETRGQRLGHNVFDLMFIKRHV